MKQCVKIRILGKVQGVAYRAMAQKHAQALDIEGTIQNTDEGSVTIFACGQTDNLDKFIDVLYKGTSQSEIKDIIVEPLINDRDFRGVFRIIGD